MYCEHSCFVFADKKEERHVDTAYDGTKWKDSFNLHISPDEQNEGFATESKSQINCRFRIATARLFVHAGSVCLPSTSHFWESKYILKF